MLHASSRLSAKPSLDFVCNCLCSEKIPFYHVDVRASAPADHPMLLFPGFNRAQCLLKSWTGVFHTARVFPVPDKTSGACVRSREIAMLIPHIHSRSTTARRFIT